METAVFKKYEDGYYTFLLEHGEELVFEEVHPRVFKQFDLKNDKSLLNKSFEFSFIEIIDDDDEDFVIYRIETLKQL